jgi:hypothetical protein
MGAGCGGGGDVRAWEAESVSGAACGHSPLSSSSSHHQPPPSSPPVPTSLLDPREHMCSEPVAEALAGASLGTLATAGHVVVHAPWARA